MSIIEKPEYDDESPGSFYDQPECPQWLRDLRDESLAYCEAAKARAELARRRKPAGN
jgi:hypothetical protein